MAEGHLRKRGVAVVIRHDKVLLVKDKGKHHYSFPGGEVHTHESPYQVTARELYEETGLRVTKLTWLGSFKSPVTEHKAFLIEAKGHLHLKGRGNKGGGELGSGYAVGYEKSDSGSVNIQRKNETEYVA